MTDPLIQKLLDDIAGTPRVVERAREPLPPLAAEIDRLRELLALIVREYDAALADKSVIIPTRLHLAIEAARA